MGQRVLGSLLALGGVPNGYVTKQDHKESHKVHLCPGGGQVYRLRPQEGLGLLRAQLPLWPSANITGIQELLGLVDQVLFSLSKSKEMETFRELLIKDAEHVWRVKY